MRERTSRTRKDDQPTTSAPGKESTPTRFQKPYIRAMIIHILKVYPTISPTMLQNALGPMTRANVWRPVLDELIEEELVTLTNETVATPHGRYNSYKKLSLTEAGWKEPSTTH